MSHLDDLREYEQLLEEVIRAKKKYLSSALISEAEAFISLNGGASDHEAYIRKVLPYWERFAYVPEEIWFQFVGSRDNVIDPGFIPHDLLYNEIIPYLNNIQFVDAVTDKSYYRMWFPDARQARTICSRVAGIYYDEEMNIISRDEALRLCMDSACEMFIKPSIYTSRSRGISTADTRCTDAGELEGIFEKTGMNFIVQQKIEMHPGLAVLNPDSVPAVRINSLLMDDEVHILSEVMRVGARGEKVPFQKKGGYYTEILKDGSLCDKVLFVAHHESDGVISADYSWRSAEEYGYYDGSYRVPMMDKLRGLTKKLHPRLARFRYIGWDLTLDRDGEPVLIEINLAPGIMCGQISICTPAFGDMTDRVLEDFFFERSLEDVQTQGLLAQ